MPSKEDKPIPHHTPEKVTRHKLAGKDASYLVFVLAVHRSSIPTILIKVKLCWAGYIAYMPDNGMAKKCFCELKHGNHSLNG